MNLSIRAAIDHVPERSMGERTRPLGGRWGERLDRQINIRRVPPTNHHSSIKWPLTAWYTTCFVLVCSL